MSRSGGTEEERFFQELEERLAACSAEDLRYVFRELSRYLPEQVRTNLLAILVPGCAVLPPTTEAVEPEPPGPELLENIRDLRVRLESDMENPDYTYEDEDEYREYMADDSLGPYEDYLDEVVDYFIQTREALAQGESALARDAYQALFEICALEDEYGRGLHRSSLPHDQIDVDRVALDYLALVYRLEEPAARPGAFHDALQQISGWCFWQADKPIVTELFAHDPALPDQAAFLDAWIQFLRSLESRQTDIWLRQAVVLHRGVAGLAELAREEGERRPHAYLDWCQALLAEHRYPEMLNTAGEALQRLPEDLAIRAGIADCQDRAARELDDGEALLRARWQALLAEPRLARLLALHEATAPGGRQALAVETVGALTRLDREMSGSLSELDVLNSYDRPPGLESRREPSPLLLLQAHLLTGRMDQALAFTQQRRDESRSGKSPLELLTLTALLTLLGGHATAALPPNLRVLWQGYDGGSSYPWLFMESGSGVYGTPMVQPFQDVCREILAGVDPDDEQRARYLDWCLDITRQQVAQIVGGQNRRFYSQAATLTGACAEMLRTAAGEIQADRFVAEIRERYPRHRAFQSELQEALNRR